MWSVSFVLDMLIIVYNKMYDNSSWILKMLAPVENIDKIIMVNWHMIW